MSIDINWSLLSEPSSSKPYSGVRVGDGGPAGPGVSTPSPPHSETFAPSDLPTPSQAPAGAGPQLNPSNPSVDPSSANHEELLTSSLISMLNAQLSSAKRPSFIGPVTVTSFSFGQHGPELEIKDIRDVWRVFDEGDEEGDLVAEEMEEEATRQEAQERDLEELNSGLDGERYELVSPTGAGMYGDDYGYAEYGIRGKRRAGRGHGFSASTSRVDAGPSMYRRPHSAIPPTPGRIPQSTTDPPARLATTARSTTSHPRSQAQSQQRSFIPFPFDQSQHQSSFAPGAGVGFGVPQTPGMSNHTHSLFSPGLSLAEGARRPASIASMPLGLRSTGMILPRMGAPLNPTHSQLDEDQVRHLDGGGTKPAKSALTREPTLNQFSPPPSPPAHPRGFTPSNPSSSIPSLQIHLQLSHTSDLNLTLLTSLQVNYPSKLFMALPLKISITGFQLQGQIVLAYSGEKNRVHLTVLDGDAAPAPAPGSAYQSQTGAFAEEWNKQPQSVGMRLLPHLQIESEIGHVDAHVLRNVGKVERFIVDVVRKTLVDELVFPNFHTIAL